MKYLNDNMPKGTVKRTAFMIAMLPLLLNGMMTKGAQASPSETLLNLSIPSVSSGQTVGLDALLTVRGSGGRSISGKRVELEVSGQVQSATTDASGDARFTYVAPQVATFFSQSIVARFAGDREYKATERRGNIHIIAPTPPPETVPALPMPSTHPMPSYTPTNPVVTMPNPIVPPSVVRPNPSFPPIVVKPTPVPPIMVKSPQSPSRPIPIQSVLSAYDRAGLLGSEISLQARLTDEAGKPIVGATLNFSVLSSELNFNSVGVTDINGVATSVSPIRIIKASGPVDQFLTSTWPIHVFFTGRYPYPAVSAQSTLTLTSIFQRK